MLHNSIEIKINNRLESWNTTGYHTQHWQQQDDYKNTQ